MNIDHRESSVKVYATKDYSRFKFIKGNRDLYLPTVKKITHDIMIEGVDILKYVPIMVYEENGFLWIMEGQHRFTVCRDIKSYVWYVISPKMEVKDIARINSNSQSWKDRDFIDSYIRQGNHNYIVLQELKSQTGYSTIVLFQLLSTGRVEKESGIGTEGKKMPKGGEFKVTHEQYTRDLIEEMKIFKPFPLYNTCKFMHALDRIIYEDPEKSITRKYVWEIFHKRHDFTRKTAKEYYFFLRDLIYEDRKSSAA